MVVGSPFWICYFLTVGMTLLLNPESPEIIQSKEFVMIVEDYLMFVFSDWAAKTFGYFGFSERGRKENKDEMKKDHIEYALYYFEYAFRIPIINQFGLLHLII